MEEDLADILMKARKVVIHMECDGELSWVRSLVYLLPTQIMDHWVDWITKPSSGGEVPNIDWIISVFPGTKIIYGRPETGIKPWAHTVKALRDLLKNRCNLKG